MKNAKWIALVVAVLVLAGGVAWQSYQRFFASRVAPAARTVEAALVTPDVFVLATFNVAQAVALERRVASAPPPAAKPNGAQGIDPRRHIAHIVAAGYLTDAGKLQTAAVALGSFTPAAVRASLQHAGYQVREETVEGRAVWRVQRQDENTCAPGQEWLLVVAADRVVAVHPNAAATIFQRLQDAAPAARDLERWRAFSSPHLASVGVFVPSKLLNAPNAQAQALLAPLKPDLEGFDSAYFGAGLKPLPAGAQFELLLTGDAARVQSTATDWQQSWTTARAKLTTQMPTVAALLDAVAIAAQGTELKVTATMDQAWLQRARNIPTELVSMMFGTATVPSPAPTGAPPTEQLDEQPAVYRAEFDAQTLPPYNPKASFAGTVDAVAGPVGVRVNSLTLPNGNETGGEIEIEAIATGDLNGASKSRLRLYVTEVRNAKNDNLLRAEPCGPERNAAPAELERMFKNTLQAKKTVRLRPDAAIADATGLVGYVELHLPVRTESVVLAANESNRSVVRDGVRLELGEVKGGSFSYRIAGAADKIVELRALNADKKPLAARSSWHTDLLFGEGRSGSREFAGQVAYVEAVIATQEQVLKFPFTVSSLRPGSAGEHLKRSEEWVPVPPAQVKTQLLRTPTPPAKELSAALATAKVGPFVLALERLIGFSEFAPALQVWARDVAVLEQSLSAVEVKIGEVVLRDGSVQRVAADAPAASSAWLDFARPFGEEGLLRASATLAPGLKVKGDQVQAMSGTMVVRVPAALTTLSFADVRLGERAADEQTELVISALGRDQFTLRATHGGERVVAVRAFNKGGQELWAPFHTITQKDGRWQAAIKVQGVPAKIDVLLAQGVERLEYPFSLKLK